MKLDTWVADALIASRATSYNASSATDALQAGIEADRSEAQALIKLQERALSFYFDAEQISKSQPALDASNAPYHVPDLAIATVRYPKSKRIAWLERSLETMDAAFYFRLSRQSLRAQEDAFTHRLRAVISRTADRPVLEALIEDIIKTIERRNLGTTLSASSRVKRLADARQDFVALASKFNLDGRDISVADVVRWAPDDEWAEGKPTPFYAFDSPDTLTRMFLNRARGRSIVNPSFRRLAQARPQPLRARRPFTLRARPR